MTGNTDTVDAPEVQVCEPIERGVDEPPARVLIVHGLEPIRKLGQRVRKTEVDAACREYQDEDEAPEAQRAVQVPGESLPADSAPHAQTSTPGPHPRPPDDEAGERDQENCNGADTVDETSRGTREQVVVQVDEAFDQAHAERGVFAAIHARCREHRHVHLVSIHQHAAGDADEQNVESYADAAPEVYLEERPAGPDPLRLSKPALPDVQSIAFVHPARSQTRAPDVSSTSG